MIIKHLGPTDYTQTLHLMQSWTEERTSTTQDECWITEHPPVFTLGQSVAKSSTYKNCNGKLHNINLVQSDRGGKITYHGPGQIIIYLLIDLQRIPLKIKDLVFKSEDLVISFLRPHKINAHRRSSMPGVYVDDIKVSSIGYKIRHGRSYHGISINYSMDMTPFSLIDVCGYTDLQVSDLHSLGLNISYAQALEELEQLLPKIFQDT